MVHLMALMFLDDKQHFFSFYLLQNKEKVADEGMTAAAIMYMYFLILKV